jgi:hypothetical protein
MQDTARSLLIAGARSAMRLVVNVQAAVKIAALYGPVVNEFAVAFKRNGTQNEIGGDHPLPIRPPISAVHTVTLPVALADQPADRVRSVSGDVRRPVFAQARHDASVPWLNQWAIDARGNPLPWIIVPSGSDGIRATS